MKKPVTIFAVILILTSCFNNVVNETIDVVKIDAFENPDQNEALGYDLVSYNYTKKIKARFPDLNLKNVTIQSFRKSVNNEVTIRLILNNSAIGYSKDLTDFLGPIIKQDIIDYKNHYEQLNKAITSSDNYRRLIDGRKVDSLWNMTSSDFKLGVKKSDFEKAILQKDSTFKVKPRKLLNRQYSNSLYLGPKEIKADLYVVNFTYKGAFEQIILQGDSLKLIGYQFYKTN